MAKKSGSKSSRNERRAGRKRAERAREHGLPVRPDAPQRVRASTPQPGSDRDGRDGEDRSSDAPAARTPKPAGIPTLVKVIGGALVILLGVFLLSRQREEALTETKPAPELPASSAAPSPSSSPEAEPAEAPAASAAPVTPPVVDAPAAGPVISVTPPTRPVVVAPVVPAPASPMVDKPHVVAPKPPTPVAAPAPVAVPAAPVAASPAPVPAAPAPAPAPKPAAPKPPVPAKPADNPY